MRDFPFISQRTLRGGAPHPIHIRNYRHNVHANETILFTLYTKHNLLDQIINLHFWLEMLVVDNAAAKKKIDVISGVHSN